MSVSPNEADPTLNIFVKLAQCLDLLSVCESEDGSAVIQLSIDECYSILYSLDNEVDVSGTCLVVTAMENIKALMTKAKDKATLFKVSDVTLGHINFLVAFSDYYIKKEDLKAQREVHDTKGDVLGSIELLTKLADSSMKFLHEQRSFLTDQQKKAILCETKTMLVMAVTMKNYFIKVDLAADKKKSDLEEVSKSGETHYLSEEQIRLQLYEECLMKDIQHTFEDIKGNQEAKRTASNVAVYPFLYPHLMKNTKSANACMLFGPPGCGKSVLAYAVGNAVQGRAKFFRLTPDSLKKPIYGQTERYIKAFGKMIRANSPCVVFIDECETLFSARSETDKHGTDIKGLLLIEFDMGKSWNEGVVLIVVTNLPWVLDPAFDSRFQTAVYVGLPKAKVTTLQIA